MSLDHSNQKLNLWSSIGFLVLLAIGIAITSVTYAQDTFMGKWKTIDDISGQPRSVIEIFERSGKFHARVTKIYSKPGEDTDPVCSECPPEDARYNKKIIGMEILNNMVEQEGTLVDGIILDPENGKSYRCKAWIEGQILRVRGYWGPFYRTQTWHKVP